MLAQPPIVPSHAALTQGILDYQQLPGFLGRQVKPGGQFMRLNVIQRPDWLTRQLPGQHTAGGDRMGAPKGLEGHFPDPVGLNTNIENNLGTLLPSPGTAAGSGFIRSAQRSNVLRPGKMLLNQR